MKEGARKLKKCVECGKMFKPSIFNWDRQIRCGGKGSKCWTKNHNRWTIERYAALKEIEKKYIKIISA